MALSKLNLLFFTPKTPPPTFHHPPPELHLIPSRSSSILRLETQLTIPVLQPKLALKTSIFKEEESEKEKEKENPRHENYKDHSDYLSVAFPSLAFPNILFFNGTYNFQLVVDENEPEEVLINRFRRESFRTRVPQECKRRQYFENTREKKKRKARDAARRNRKRRPPPKVSEQSKAADSMKKLEDADDDNWEFFDIDLPYC